MTLENWLVVIGLIFSGQATAGAIFAWGWSNINKRIDTKASNELADRLEKKVDGELCKQRHDAIAEALTTRNSVVDDAAKRRESAIEPLFEMTRKISERQIVMAAHAGVELPGDK
jgi:hypothetical protein